LEALIAAVLALTLLFSILPKIVPGEQSLPSVDVLENLGYDDDFRNCVLANTFSCVNSSVYFFMPNLYKNSYVVYLVNDSNFVPQNLPNDRRVYADSLFIAGNLTSYNPVIVRLYYWS